MRTFGLIAIGSAIAFSMFTVICTFVAIWTGTGEEGYPHYVSTFSAKIGDTAFLFFVLAMILWCVGGFILYATPKEK